MERAVKPITSQLKTRIVPKLISLTEDESYVWLHWKGKAIILQGNSYKKTYLWKLGLTNGKINHAVAFLDTYELALLINSRETTMNKTIEEIKTYIGMWMTADGHIRHELLSNNRYDEARSNCESAYREVTM